jgi:phosphoglucosamine mutase
VPQMLKNVRFTAGTDPLATTGVAASIADAESKLRGKGRLLIRKSGTEPLIRVMAECEDEAMLRDVVEEIVGAVQAAV